MKKSAAWVYAVILLIGILAICNFVGKFHREARPITELGDWLIYYGDGEMLKKIENTNACYAVGEEVIDKLPEIQQALSEYGVNEWYPNNLNEKILVPEPKPENLPLKPEEIIAYVDDCYASITLENGDILRIYHYQVIVNKGDEPVNVEICSGIPGKFEECELYYVEAHKVAVIGHRVPIIGVIPPHIKI